MSGKKDVAGAVEDVVEAARDVDRWYYEQDAMWMKLTPEERQEADAAVIRLHDALEGLEEGSGKADDD